MKRRLFSLLLCLALCLAYLPASAGAAFADIDDAEVAVAAAALQGMGVVSGTTSSTFEPDSTLTRAQVCAMAVNAAGLSSQVSTYARRTLFSDVPASSWYNGYVNLAYSEGLVNGNGDGTFSPDRSVTYGELATILLRMLGYTSAEIGSVWPLDYTGFCDDLGLSQGLGLGAYDTVTRGEAAILFYRTLKTEINGSEQPYYETIEGVASTEEAIVLDTDASYGGSSGLLMVYSPDSGIVYYTQKNTQSDALERYLGVLLFSSSGQVTGFLPEDGGYLDLTIGSATASTLTSSAGTSYRISSGAVVISSGETYDYSTSGYLQLNSRRGNTVRLYYADDGSVAYLYLSGGTASSSEAVVATASSASSIARALGISGSSYAITKNGAAAESGDAAAYDVGYYDAATGTLRLSDYRVSGYLSAASPSVTAATTVTLAGYTFDVLECAWNTLGELELGDKVTLLLTDDCKVAAAYPASEVSAEMVGVLSEDGRSVTLSGSGITLTADTISCDADQWGTLVTVSAASASRLRCSSVTGRSAGALDLAEGTLGDLELAPALAVYEWTGSGYVYSLEGERGTASADFDAVTWTDSLSASAVSYYHTNSAGQVDVLLLEDVTGNCYDYGEITVYTGSDGINLGSGGSSGMDAYNRAAVLTSSGGSTSKFLCALSASTGSMVGVAMGRYSDSYEKAASLQKLTKLTGVTAADFFQEDGDWYVEADGEEYPVSEQVQVLFESSETWLEGESGLTTALADAAGLTLYCDRDPDQGGQIRVITAD